MKEIDSNKWRIYLKDVINVEAKVKVLNNPIALESTKEDMEVRLAVIMENPDYMIASA